MTKQRLAVVNRTVLPHSLRGALANLAPLLALTALAALTPTAARADGMFEATSAPVTPPPRVAKATARTAPARLAVVIDDIGYDRRLGLRAIRLPGQLTMAVIPHTPNAVALARAAHGAGKEVIIHQPMQGSNYTHAGAAIQGTMTLAMGPQDLNSALLNALASVPHAVGINNHTGSTLTGNRRHMSWLMQGLAAERDLYYLDSRTTAQTVAREAADAWGVPFASRDVFLDHHDNRRAIEAEFDRALSIARRRGHAVLIAHPRPLSLAALERRLAGLNPDEITLVPVSALIDRPARWNRTLTATAGGQ